MAMVSCLTLVQKKEFSPAHVYKTHKVPCYVVSVNLTSCFKL